MGEVELPPMTVLQTPLVVSVPQPGYFKRLSPRYYATRYNGNKRRKPVDSDWLPVMIWHGDPVDPVTGEQMERRHGWQCLVAGQPFDALEQWSWACGNPINAMEYHEMMDAVKGLPSLAELMTEEPS